MLLRVSGEVRGDEVDLSAIVDDAAAASSGVAHAEALLALAEAMVGEDDDALALARAGVVEKLGPEADLWEARKTANVIRALSLVPDEVRGLKDLSGAHYMKPAEMMDFRARGPLDRAQIELIAARVSALRECFY